MSQKLNIDAHRVRWRIRQKKSINAIIVLIFIFVLIVILNKKILFLPSTLPHIKTIIIILKY